MNPISVDGDVGVVVPDPESPESEASFRERKLRSFGGAEEEGGGDEAEASRGSSDAFSSSAGGGAATERTRLSMRLKCAAGSDSPNVSSSSIFVSLSPVSASIPDRASRVCRASAADAAASCAAFAGAQRHHTSPSAPSAKARAPRVAKSRGAPMPFFSCLFSSLSLPPEENGDGARGYHARTAALTTSTTAIAFSDEDKTHGPRAWSAPNSHFLGNFFLSARRLARGAEDAEPGDALASGTEGRTVASTFASESSPSVAARHTHSRRPGRAPNIQYTLFALVPAARFVFVSVSFSSEDGFFSASSASSCASVSSGTAARVHPCALAPNAPSRGFAPMGVFLNPFARCSKQSCVVVDTSAAPPSTSKNDVCTTGASNRTVCAPPRGPSRYTTETAPASSPLIRASPLGDHAMDVTFAPLCPLGMPASYRPEDGASSEEVAARRLCSGSANATTTTSPSSNANAHRVRRSFTRRRVTGLDADPPAWVSTMNRSRNLSSPSSGRGEEAIETRVALVASASSSSNASPSRVRRSKTYTLPMLEPNTTSRGEASTHSSWTRGPVTARTASASARHCEARRGEGREGSGTRAEVHARSRRPRRRRVP